MFLFGRVKNNVPRRLLFVFELLAILLLFIYQGQIPSLYTALNAVGFLIIVYISNLVLGVFLKKKLLSLLES